jgi:hypothetical protein
MWSAPATEISRKAAKIAKRDGNAGGTTGLDIATPGTPADWSELGALAALREICRPYGAFPGGVSVGIKASVGSGSDRSKAAPRRRGTPRRFVRFVSNFVRAAEPA